jgi:MFS transporter, DHA2 family, multidrug resistance protein
MILLLLLGPVLLPEFRDPDAGRIDLFSAALSILSVLAVIYGLKETVQDGFGWLSALAILAGIAVGVAFVRRQTKLADPLIDLRLFRAPGFSAALAVYTLGILILFGTFLFVYQYLQLVEGLSPFKAGLWTLPAFGGFVAGSMLAPLIVRRVRPAYVMGAGLALGALSFALMAQVDADSGLGVIVASTILFSLGLGPLFTLTNDLIIGSAPPERAGAASGISETGAELGGALSIAILGSIGTAVYRDQMSESVPAAVPGEAADTARDTLGGAVTEAAALPAPLGAELLEAAREAFTQGLQVAALTSAAVAAVTAVLAVVLLRRVDGASAEQPEMVDAQPVPEQ